MYCAFSIPVHQSLNIQENEVEMSELLNQLWTPELQAAFTVVVVLLVILYVLSIVWVVRDAYLRGSYWYVWAIVALVPLLGIIAYCLLRPPLLQIDRDEQELEIALKQRELMKYGECANCGYPVEADFVLCPNCHQRLKNLCGTCNHALDDSPGRFADSLNSMTEPAFFPLDSPYVCASKAVTEVFNSTGMP